MLQAQELLSGPLATAPGDVLLGGDLNSGPDQKYEVNRLAYEALITGGMRDSWLVLYPGEPGYTSDLGKDLDQPADQIFERIDMIMFRGSVMPISARTFGVEWQTPDGRWASDHLGYAAVFTLL